MVLLSLVIQKTWNVRSFPRDLHLHENLFQVSGAMAGPEAPVVAVPEEEVCMTASTPLKAPLVAGPETPVAVAEEEIYKTSKTLEAPTGTSGAAEVHQGW